MDEQATTAIILCAGRGGRLRPLTDDRPKCLLSPGGRPILERCLDGLRGAGVRQTVIVTGYRAEMVEGFVRSRDYPGVRFVRNLDYADTNTAVSLRLALRELDADVLVLNGDVVFDPALLDGLIARPEPGVVMVDGEASLSTEEVKIIAEGDRVARIGKDLDPALCLGEAIGLNKIGRSLLPELVRVYVELERRGEKRHFFEKGFDLLAGSDGARPFGMAHTRGLPWVEIDTLEDFSHAERDIIPRIRA
jgi:choline kinase